MEPFRKPGILVTVASELKFLEGFTKMCGVLMFPAEIQFSVQCIRRAGVRRIHAPDAYKSHIFACEHFQILTGTSVPYLSHP